MASSIARRIKLKQFAEEQGISYVTAYRHWQSGNISGIQLPGGSILVDGWKNSDTGNNEEQDTKTILAVIYSRVVGTSQQEELKAQTNRLKEYAKENGYEVLEVVEEVATAFSDRRPKLLNLLHRKDWNILLVEEEGTLLKFGFPYIEVLLKDRGQEIRVASKADGTHNALDGEYELVSLIRKVKEFTKPIIGYQGQKGQIDNHINALMR
jgi:putative resolvase